jgi:peptidyl-prolyl cis-trans isomerase C
MYDVRRVMLGSGFAAVLLLGCLQAPQSAAAQRQATGKGAGAGDVVAVVNGKPITQELLDIYAGLQKSARPGTSPDRQALVEHLVDLEVLAQDAVRQGLEKDPLVKAQMEFQRLNILASADLRKELNARNFTEDELKAEYARLVAAAPKKEYRARHILTKTQAEAEASIAQLNKGTDFAKLAEQKSTDASGKKGGELGWFTTNQMAEPFAKAVEGLSKGSYTKTPVETPFGWHVIQLEDVRDVKLPSFDAVRHNVEQELQAKLANEYVAKIKAKAKIEMR